MFSKQLLMSDDSKWVYCVAQYAVHFLRSSTILIEIKVLLFSICVFLFDNVHLFMLLCTH